MGTFDNYMMYKQLRPSEQRSRSYVDGIKQHNSLLRKNVSDYLDKEFAYLSEDDNLSIVTTGSDGRCEKSLLSPVELILLNSGSKNLERASSDLERVIYERSDIFEPCVEIKDLDNQKSSIFYNTNQLFPTRALDSVKLIGSDELALRYKLKVVEEFTGEDGKNYLNKVKNRKRDPRKILESSFSKHGLNFDLDNGELFYDGHCIKSTKYGHLRTVQYKMAADVCSAIRSKVIDIDNLDSNITGNISDRLYNLYYQDLIDMSATEVSDVTDAYLTSVYWYHLSEEMYIKNNEGSINVDIGEFKEVTSILRDFGRRKNIFK